MERYLSLHSIQIGGVAGLEIVKVAVRHTVRLTEARLNGICTLLVCWFIITITSVF